jgi:hypothetical protein
MGVLRNASLAVRVAQQPIDGMTPTGPVDFGVTLVDSSMNISTVWSTAWRQVAGIYVSWIEDKRPDPAYSTKGIFETFVFPWWAFVADGRTLNLGEITEFRIEVGGVVGTGQIAIDDLEIWR